MAYTYPPPEPRTIPPPTNNTLSSKERSALVRSTKKIGRMLGDIPRFVDDIEDQFVMVTPPRPPTPAGPSKEDTWRSRKPTHLPPLMKLAGGIAVDSNSPPMPLRTAPARRASTVSTSSNKSSIQDQPLTPSKEAAHRRSKMERLRRRLGEEVPMEAVFPATPGLRTAVPHTAKPERSRNHNRSRSVHPSHDDTVTFSIDHHTVVLKTSTRANHAHSPHPGRSHHPHKSAHRPPPLPMTGLPPMPIPKHSRVSDEAGLLGARAKTAAGSKMGGAEFKAARRAKREGFGEVEMVGFMGGF
ncbi:hypothetical protein DEU56DRAFT_833010 [Suillus clintonianus]|uniref:uncharacterized protein n=1 Tax=Suillus clintonianus TaxID=1904413 RepID=UPI001B886E4F|nr:uncharacterized protein DEU56DRAFT_833010 [Suillus clintonianus]KAG2121958.1 hypothetical protein DEU56DRAFT_833010 [Suillus clintonianus]